LSAIRYLDLGIDEKQSSRNAILALVAALLIICVVVWLQEVEGPFLRPIGIWKCTCCYRVGRSEGEYQLSRHYVDAMLCSV